MKSTLWSLVALFLTFQAHAAQTVKGKIEISKLYLQEYVHPWGEVDEEDFQLFVEGALYVNDENQGDISGKVGVLVGITDGADYRKQDALHLRGDKAYARWCLREKSESECPVLGTVAKEGDRLRFTLGKDVSDVRIRFESVRRGFWDRVLEGLSLGQIGIKDADYIDAIFYI